LLVGALVILAAEAEFPLGCRSSDRTDKLQLDRTDERQRHRTDRVSSIAPLRERYNPSPHL
jgi:hypothetical protein